MVTSRVVLWTAPRCVSTAFERSIMTLSNTKVFHESFEMPFYFGPERQSSRYLSTPVNSKETYSNVKTMLCKDYDGIDVVFCKDMAYYMENKFALFLDEDLKAFKHTFLIRDPAQAIRSFYRVSLNPKLPAWGYFDGEEVGFSQLYELYQFVTKHLDSNPVVVDADDLLDHPDETMKSYCDAVGITYEPHMTTWEPDTGSVVDWPWNKGIWAAAWQETLLHSSGFIPRTTKNTNDEQNEVLPKEVTKTIEESAPYYTYLKARKI